MMDAKPEDITENFKDNDLKLESINIRIHSEVKKNLQAIAKAKKMSLSDLIRYIFDQLLN